jgi:excisionase family DNA binding protein
MSNKHDLLRELAAEHAALELELAARIAAMEARLRELAEILHADDKRLRRADAPARMSMERSARYLGISKTTLYKMVHDEVIPAAETDSGRRVLRKADLDAWVGSLPSANRVRERFPEQVAS